MPFCVMAVPNLTLPSSRPSTMPLTPLEELADRAKRHSEDQQRASRARATLSFMAQPQVKPEDQPQALVLVTNVYECQCGRAWPAPNTAVLVRYDRQGHSNSVHYRRETAAPFLHLPREQKIISRPVPFCEACFPS